MFLLQYIRLLGMSIMLSGCTYSITMIHTEGAATDVVDETQSNTPTVSPNASMVPRI